MYILYLHSICSNIVATCKINKFPINFSPIKAHPSSKNFYKYFFKCLVLLALDGLVVEYWALKVMSSVRSLGQTFEKINKLVIDIRWVVSSFFICAFDYFWWNRHMISAGAVHSDNWVFRVGERKKGIGLDLALYESSSWRRWVLQQCIPPTVPSHLTFILWSISV